MLNLLLSLALNFAHAQPDCGPVLANKVARAGVVSTIYSLADDPTRHVTLRVTSRFEPLKNLGALGLRRRSRATRGLNLEGTFDERLDHLVRVNEMHFEPTGTEAARHRYPSYAKPLREQFAADFADRAALVAEMLRRNAGTPNVYRYDFTNELLALRDLVEVAHLGETRFATQTWLAQTFRRYGVKGAIMIDGTLPTSLPDLRSGPMRPTEAPTVLFFQPVRP